MPCNGWSEGVPEEGVYSVIIVLLPIIDQREVEVNSKHPGEKSDECVKNLSGERKLSWIFHADNALQWSQLLELNLVRPYPVPTHVRESKEHMRVSEN